MINLINELQNLIKPLKTTIPNIEKNSVNKTNTPTSTPKNETQATKNRHRSTSRKEKDQKSTPNPPIETKNKLKNIEQIEMDSTPTIKKQMQLEQKAQAPVGQAGRIHANTQVNSERPRGTFKLPPAKFDIYIYIYIYIYSVESMDCDRLHSFQPRSGRYNK